jgi:hypothetical protein
VRLVRVLGITELYVGRLHCDILSRGFAETERSVAQWTAKASLSLLLVSCFGTLFLRHVGLDANRPFGRMLIVIQFLVHGLLVKQMFKLIFLCSQLLPLKFDLNALMVHLFVLKV